MSIVIVGGNERMISVKDMGVKQRYLRKKKAL